MNRCEIPFEALVDYCDGRADARVSADVEAHLANECPACVPSTARLQRILTAVPGAAIHHAPSRAIARAINAFQQQQQVHTSRLRHFASLLFDSRSGLAPAGARGDAGATSQQAFSTPEHDIDVWQERGEDGDWYIIGQVLPKAGGSALVPTGVVLEESSRESSRREITGSCERSEFHLRSVRSGTYTLVVYTEPADIVITELVVGN